MSTKSIAYNQAFRYVDEFLGLKCASDILDMSIFPNGKEITESMGAYDAARRYTQLSLSDPGVHVLVVGDGKHPRTGVLFAMRSKWNVASVDPESVHPKTLGQTTIKRYTVDRLSVYPCPVQNVDLDFTGKTLVIVGVHSHARNSDILRGVRFDKATLINMPCCVYQPPVSDDFIEYEDIGVWSPHNKITISFDSLPNHWGWTNDGRCYRKNYQSC